MEDGSPVQDIKRPVLNIGRGDLTGLQESLSQAPNYADVSQPEDIFVAAESLAAIIISKRELLGLQEIGLDPDCVRPSKLIGAVHKRFAEYSRDKPILVPLLPAEIIPVSGNRRKNRAALVIAQQQVFMDERKLARNAIRESISQSYGSAEVPANLDGIWIGNYYPGVKLAVSHNHATKELLGHLRTDIHADHRLLPAVVELGRIVPEEVDL